MWVSVILMVFDADSSTREPAEAPFRQERLSILGFTVFMLALIVQDNGQLGIHHNYDTPQCYQLLAQRYV